MKGPTNLTFVPLAVRCLGKRERIGVQLNHGIHGLPIQLPDARDVSFRVRPRTRPSVSKALLNGVDRQFLERKVAHAGIVCAGWRSPFNRQLSRPMLCHTPLQPRAVPPIRRFVFCINNLFIVFSNYGPSGRRSPSLDGGAGVGSLNDACPRSTKDRQNGVTWTALEGWNLSSVPRSVHACFTRGFAATCRAKRMLPSPLADCVVPLGCAEV